MYHDQRKSGRRRIVQNHQKSLVQSWKDQQSYKKSLITQHVPTHNILTNDQKYLFDPQPVYEKRFSKQQKVDFYWNEKKRPPKPKPKRSNLEHLFGPSQSYDSSNSKGYVPSVQNENFKKKKRNLHKRERPKKKIIKVVQPKEPVQSNQPKKELLSFSYHGRKRSPFLSGSAFGTERKKMLLGDNVRFTRKQPKPREKSRVGLSDGIKTVKEVKKKKIEKSGNLMNNIGDFDRNRKKRNRISHEKNYELVTKFGKKDVSHRLYGVNNKYKKKIDHNNKVRCKEVSKFGKKCPKSALYPKLKQLSPRTLNLYGEFGVAQGLVQKHKNNVIQKEGYSKRNLFSSLYVEKKDKSDEDKSFHKTNFMMNLYNPMENEQNDKGDLFGGIGEFERKKFEEKIKGDKKENGKSKKFFRRRQKRTPRRKLGNVRRVKLKKSLYGLTDGDGKHPLGSNQFIKKKKKNLSGRVFNLKTKKPEEFIEPKIKVYSGILDDSSVSEKSGFMNKPSRFERYETYLKEKI